MRNPFRSEGDAFRVLVLVVAVSIPVAIAGIFGPFWVPICLAAIAIAVAAAIARRQRGRTRPLRTAPAHVGPPGERRIVVVANDTLGDERLIREIGSCASAHRARVLLLAPALVPAAHRWFSDVDAAREQARRRLDAVAARVGPGVVLVTQVADEEPLQAIEDALRTFGGDELVICTRDGRSPNGLEPGLADLVRERFALPVAHLVFAEEKPAAGVR